MDKSTIDKIISSHPKIRESLLKDYTEANNLLGKGCRLRFAYVVRTNAEQDTLYALGRTKVNPDGKSAKKPMGNIITNAKGGQSIHNYGLAFDIVLLYDKNADGIFESVSWDMVKDGDHDGKSDWMEIANFFQSRGWEWGGKWTSFKDFPHFQKAFGMKWQQMKMKLDNNDFKTENGIKYINL